MLFLIYIKVFKAYLNQFYELILYFLDIFTYFYLCKLVVTTYLHQII